MTLRDAGENALLARLLPTLAKAKGVVVAAGDDCAVLETAKRDTYQLLKTDCVVENVHFDRRASAVEVGWKAMARTLSDFAAMSGVPRYALVTLIAPSTTRYERVSQLYRGLNNAARRFGVAIVGGETSSTSGPLAVSVSVVGDVERDRCVLRSGASAGDALFVTGRLGGTLRRKHLRFVPRIAESRWLTQHFRIRAMMDVSDGLGADLPRLAVASSVGFDLYEEALPRARGCSVQQAINDGEDYELLFAIARRDADRLQRDWRRRFPTLPLTRIGSLVRRSRTKNRTRFAGYEHFQQR